MSSFSFADHGDKQENGLNDFSPRIALVSKTNGCFGGASYFAENLGAWLQQYGCTVTHFCVEPKQQLRCYQRQIQFRSTFSRLMRHFNWRVRRIGIIEPLPSEYWFGLKNWLSCFDAFHFHDLYMAVSPQTLSLVAKHRPTLFTVHDCSGFTGGCLYPVECERSRAGCGSCPRRAEIGRFDFTSWNLRQMRKLATSKAVHYIFPSKWIQNEALCSLHIQGSSTHIANGFAPEPYSYCDQHGARSALGLPAAARIVALSSGVLQDTRKGVAFALRALEANRDLNPFVILIGRSAPQIVEALSGLGVLAAGFVEERARLGLLYAAADLLLFPSLADNLPITIQEAMAAGTPVVAFRVGGIPELVEAGKTGWLVPLGDQKALNEALRRALESGETKSFGARARAFIAERFSREECVKKHLDLYKSAIETWSSEVARS